MLPKERVASPDYEVSGPLLYVTNYTSNSVTVYPAKRKSPAPIATILDGAKAPTGDCLDSQGTLYVTNQPISNNGWVAEYPLGKTEPSMMITKGIYDAAFCAIDGTGNLWVTNIGGPNVTEYLRGSNTPHTVITKGLVFPVGIAIDHSGNLYVANNLYSNSNVVVYAPGSKTPTRTITDSVTWPVGIGIDSGNTLYVPNATANNVEEYLSGQSHPYRAITRGLDFPVAAVTNAMGRLYVANFGNSNDVVEFAPGSLTPSHRKIRQDVYAPQGVAYYPPLLP
jgi:DNA-binding beta-propeller fold protein YncE